MALTLDTLPQDLILMILRYFEACDLLCLQLACRSWKQLFSEAIYLRTILRTYPHARKIRDSVSHSEDVKGLQSTFEKIACRYYHLSKGKARILQKINLRALDQSGHWVPPPQWDYHESQPGGRLYHASAAAHLKRMGWKPYLFRPTLWSVDDGLLVCAPAPIADGAEGKATLEEQGYHKLKGGQENESFEDRWLTVMDLDSGEQCPIPLDVHDKIIRNLRVSSGTVIVEWAEKEPFHALNMIDRVHRHFATCFDVTHEPSTTAHTSPQADHKGCTILKATFRSEWKIHFLGFPLSSRDYFFSTHTASHYAVYYWQPNRSLWTGDEDQPIEALYIWDISHPCSYRPSLDPSNAQRPDDATKAPYIVARYLMRGLDFLGIRQRAQTSLLNFTIDSQAKTLTWRENSFVSGQGYFDPAERNWEAVCTTFPFLGQGCSLKRQGEIELPSYRGHCSMDSAPISDEIEKWFLPVMEVADQTALIRWQVIETCFTGTMIENNILVRMKLEEDEAGQGTWKNMEDVVIKEIGAMGRIAGDERWLVGQNDRLQIVIARFQ